VLSLAAALLGWAPVLAVDVEAPSVEATRANAAANHVELEARLVVPDERLPPADVVVANISLEAVEGLPARIDAATLVTSGYFASERPALAGYEHVHRRTRDGWACDLHRRR
jgi:ribosomal protein L11 methylase PrmA